MSLTPPYFCNFCQSFNMGDSCSKEEIQDDTREEEKNRKIVIFGERKTGKTGLIERFVSGSFPPNYRTMIGVSLALKVLTVEETTKVHLQLVGTFSALLFSLFQKIDLLRKWDLAGRCTESESRAFYSKRASAVIYLYSIDSRKSFDSIVAWCNSLSLDDEVQKVFVGSKSDLEEERVVSEDEGRVFIFLFIVLTFSFLLFSQKVSFFPRVLQINWE